MGHDLYTYSLDEEAAAIVKQIPKTKKSAFVSEAVKLKARALGHEKPTETPPKPIPTVRIRI